MMLFPLPTQAPGQDDEQAEQQHETGHAVDDGHAVSVTAVQSDLRISSSQASSLPVNS
jgi:hypothetical protein